MEKKSFFNLIPVMLIGAVVCVGCGQKEKAAEPSAEANADSIVKLESAVVEENRDADMALAEESRAFLEKFYKGLDRDQLDYSLVKKNCTRQALRYLADNYDYDCESGDCLATWMFLYEGGGEVGPLKNRTFEMLDATTCKVRLVYEGYQDKDYEYIVQLGLVKEGDTYKVDAIKPLSSSY